MCKRIFVFLDYCTMTSYKKSIPSMDMRLKKLSEKQLWPEWNDSEINIEKWDLGGKAVDKKQLVPSFPTAVFDDPDGKIPLPSDIHVFCWKRPSELLVNKTLAVFDPQVETYPELISCNRHLEPFEVMVSIINQLMGLMYLNMERPFAIDPDIPNYQCLDNTVWQPWHNVYALCKAGRVLHQPMYNSYGKYIVRIHWLGCWRKIVIDDTIPLDSKDQILLPWSQYSHELWPTLITKALLKIFAIESNNFEEPVKITVIQCLTGWIGEEIILQDINSDNLWSKFKSCIPKYKWKTVKKTESDSGEVTITPVKTSKKDKTTKTEVIMQTPISVYCSEDEKIVMDGEHNYKIHMATFADFFNFHEPIAEHRMSEIEHVAKPYGLNHSKSQKVLIPFVRDCNLDPPPAPEIIPAWKLIRRHLWDKNYQDPSIEKEEIKFVGVFSLWNLNGGDNVILEVPVSVQKKGGFWKDVKLQWLDVTTFASCFRKLYIFHRIDGYNYCYKVYDSILTNTPSTLPAVARKPSLPNKKQKSASFTSGVPFYLYVDSVSPITIIMLISVLCKWHDKNVEDKELSSACIHINHYYWRSCLKGKPVIHFRTTATEATSLHLSPGRHVLKICFITPILGMLHFCCEKYFVVGDEMTLFPYLTTESQRFEEAAARLFEILLKLLKTFSQKGVFDVAERELHDELTVSGKCKLRPCLMAFKASFFKMVEIVKDKISWNPDVFRALRAFTLEANIPIVPIKEVRTEKASSKKKIVENESLFQITETRSLHEILNDSSAIDSIVMIQSIGRRFIVQQMLKCHKNPQLFRAQESLDKLASILEMQADECRKQLLRNYVDNVSNGCSEYSFWEDELNRISYYEYTGTAVHPLSSQWFVIYRDVFHVLNIPVELIPIFTSEIPNINLTVIDNDTLTETPQLFGRPIYCSYKKNKLGYTVLVVGTCEQSVLNSPIMWKLILIKSPVEEFLPMPKESVHGSLVRKELMDSYIPKKDGIVERLLMQSTEECFVTLHWAVSSSDVPLSLDIYENEIHIIHITDLSAVTVPCLRLAGDPDSEEESFQTKKYLLKLMVKNNGWKIESNIQPLVHELEKKEREKMKVFTTDDEESTSPTLETLSIPSQPLKSKKDKELSTSSVAIAPKLNLPTWKLIVVTQSAFLEKLKIKRDTFRKNEIRELKMRWQDDDSERFQKASEFRQEFLNNHKIEYSTPKESKYLEKFYDEIELVALEPLPTTVPLRPLRMKSKIDYVAVPKKDSLTTKEKDNEKYLKEQIYEKLLFFDTAEQLLSSAETERKAAMMNRELLRNAKFEVEEIRKQEMARVIENLTTAGKSSARK